MYVVEYTYSLPEWDIFETDDAADREDAEYQAEQYVKTNFPEAYDIQITKVIEV